jgi:hypothetical protein
VVYLVYKGFEILQIALMSHRENRRAGMIIGIAAVMISLLCAAVFTSMIDSQAAHVSSSSSPDPTGLDF